MYILLLTALIALVLKISDLFIFSTLPTLRRGAKFAAEFHKDYESYGGHAAVKNHINRRHIMVGTKWLGRYSKHLANYVYRWPILIAATSSALVITARSGISRELAVLAGGVLFVSIGTIVLHEVIDRLIMGVASNIHLSHFKDVAKVDHESVSWTTSEVLRRIGIAFITHIAAIWLTFSCIYYLAIKLAPNSLKDAQSGVDCLYFSAVALTTTGFGDIYPQTKLLKLLVVSELGMSWVLTVVIIFHYGATISFNLDTEKER